MVTVKLTSDINQISFWRRQLVCNVAYKLYLQKSILSVFLKLAKKSSLLWRHLLQCHTCLLTSFSTLSQLSPIWTVSPFSYFTVPCLYMMAEAKNCLEPQRYYSTQYLTSLHWRHVLQCLPTSFSTLSQVSTIFTISPFSNVTV